MQILRVKAWADVPMISKHQNEPFGHISNQQSSEQHCVNQYANVPASELQYSVISNQWSFPTPLFECSVLVLVSK